MTLTVGESEIVGLLGDNGAGKSTLIKVLSGAIRPTSGEIHVRGRKVDFRTTSDAIAEGIETIYQEFRAGDAAVDCPQPVSGSGADQGTAPPEPDGSGAMNRVASDLLRKVGIEKSIPPTTPIGSLSGGERQAVAIARAMHFDSDLIILDEPTNNLGVAETQGVLRFVRSARNSRHSCIFIAHNIHHVFQVVDRIVVLRRGRVVAGDIDPKRTSIEEVERMITGISEEAIRNAAASTGA